MYIIKLIFSNYIENHNAQTRAIRRGFPGLPSGSAQQACSPLRLPHFSLKISQKTSLSKKDISPLSLAPSPRRAAVRPSHSASLSWPFPAMPYHAQCCLTRCHGHPPPCAREMILIFSKEIHRFEI